MIALVQPIQSEIVKTQSQTIVSKQYDTLDAICHREYGENSNQFLPTLIEINPDLSPYAIIPMHTTVYLPDFNHKTTQPALKLWD